MLKFADYSEGNQRISYIANCDSASALAYSRKSDFVGRRRCPVGFHFSGRFESSAYLHLFISESPMSVNRPQTISATFAILTLFAAVAWGQEYGNELPDFVPKIPDLAVEELEAQQQSFAKAALEDLKLTPVLESATSVQKRNLTFWQQIRAGDYQGRILHRQSEQGALGGHRSTYNTCSNHNSSAAIKSFRFG